MVCFWKKDELDNQGHETNTTFREVIWCIIPNKLAINHAFQDWWNSYQKRRQWNYETGKVLSNLKTHFDWFSFQQKVLWNYFKFWKDRKPTTEISGVSVSLSNSNEGIHYLCQNVSKQRRIKETRNSMNMKRIFSSHFVFV